MFIFLILIFAVVIDIENPSYTYPESDQLRQVCVVLRTGSGQLSQPAFVSFRSVQATSGVIGLYMELNIY